MRSEPPRGSGWVRRSRATWLPNLINLFERYFRLRTHRLPPVGTDLMSQSAWLRVREAAARTLKESVAKNESKLKFALRGMTYA
jgi:hypothetical protein